MPPEKVKSILPTYDTPFYGAGVTRSFSNNPAIIIPVPSMWKND